MPQGLLNLTNREHLPVEAFSWGTLQWLCNEILVPGAKQTLGLCVIHPRQRNPIHFHPNCEELLHMISGSGKHFLDGTFVELHAGMTLRIARGVKHNLENTGDTPLTCLIAFSTGDRQTVFLETV
jgi:quercetin dioxygenase-like cupin family protein